MVIIFDRPPPCPHYNSGGVSLPSIHKDWVYIGKLTYHSVQQGVALEEGNISHNGCGTMIRNWMTRQDSEDKDTDYTTYFAAGYELCCEPQLQRMASDQAEMLKKFKENQQKPDWCQHNDIHDEGIFEVTLNWWSKKEKVLCK
jgi:hypothetical protein